MCLPVLVSKRETAEFDLENSFILLPNGIKRTKGPKQ